MEVRGSRCFPRRPPANSSGTMSRRWGGGRLSPNGGHLSVNGEASDLRVTLVTEWFPPEDVAVPSWIAHSLREQGLSVGVLTGVPHYPNGRPSAGYRATSWRLESLSGLKVLRVPEFPSHDNSTLRRMATYGSFAFMASVLGSRAVAGGDVSLVYSSPATPAFPAMVAKARFGTPYVLYIQDLWPDSMLETGFLGAEHGRALIGSAATAFVAASYRAASHICVISPGMRDALIERGVPSDKITVVFNWVDELALQPTPERGRLRSIVGLTDRDFVALFAGNAGEAQGLGAWVTAIASMTDLPHIHLVILGRGTQRQSLSDLAVRLGVSARVHMLDPVPIKDVPSLVGDADVSVVSLANRPLFKMTIPSKLQACMALGSPVVASCSGDAADLVREADAGWVALPEDSMSIALAVRAAESAGRSVRDSRGMAGRQYYLERMAREVGASTLASVLRRAVCSRVQDRAVGWRGQSE